MDKNAQLRETMQEAGQNPAASFAPGFSGMGNIGAVYTPESGVALGDSGKQVGYKVEPSDDPNKYRIGIILTLELGTNSLRILLLISSINTLQAMLSLAKVFLLGTGLTPLAKPC